MKHLSCLTLLLWPVLAYTQYKPLSIGDKVPDITFTQTINHKQQTLSLSGFKGKWVILDFWATWCTACIKKIPLLDSMQRAHAGSMQVILVNPARTGDTPETIARFLRRYKAVNGRSLSLPISPADTVISACFPFSSLPHYVWLNQDLECFAITGADELTAANLLAVIQGSKPAFAGTQLAEAFNPAKPLFVDDNGGNGSGIRFRSTLSAYIPGMRAFTPAVRTPAGLITQYKMINNPLLAIISRAYGYTGRQNRIKLSVPDSLRQMLFPATDSAKRAHTYTYELIAPPLTNSQLQRYMQQDLQRWFGLEARYEHLPAPCFLLTVDSAKLLAYRTSGIKRANNLNDWENRYIRNASLSELTDFLNSNLTRYVIQKDSVSFNLDLGLPDIPVAETTAFFDALECMGICLTPSTEPVNQFIIYQSPKQ